jgi:nitroimidazol reductase NimA-like FMN-containing flavoprotein (pyridoxamine 5'-phosphate oxidase superfamily)
MDAPRAERPGVKGYGIPEDATGLLPWAWAETHLRDALIYWISTVRPDGRPHAVPTWGVWLDGRLWFEGGTRTRRARNLAENPAAVASIHVDDDAALIVEGRVEVRSDPDPELVARLVEAFGKYRATHWAYEADPANWSSDSGGALWALRPAVVLGWSRFPGDATRWRFEG